MTPFLFFLYGVAFIGDLCVLALLGLLFAYLLGVILRSKS
jgi:hypothetical protein